MWADDGTVGRSDGCERESLIAVVQVCRPCRDPAGQLDDPHIVRPPRLGQLHACVDFAVQLASSRPNAVAAIRSLGERDANASGSSRPTAGPSLALASTVVRGAAHSEQGRDAGRGQRDESSAAAGVPRVASGRAVEQPFDSFAQMRDRSQRQRACSRGAVGELSAAICVRQRASARPFAARVTAHSSHKISAERRHSRRARRLSG